MDKKPMKRVNVILEADLYDKARVVAFVKKRSLSGIVRDALREWISSNADVKSELVLSTKDARRILRILETDEFISLEDAKKIMGER
jgi:hypothetical protein